jgi:hypothetical protein
MMVLGRPPVPKRDIRMSDAEIAAFLGGHIGCAIAYNDGGPAPAVRDVRRDAARGHQRVLRQAARTARLTHLPLASKTYVFYYSVNYSTETVAGAAHVGVLH